MADFWDKEEFIGKVTKNNREEIQIKKVEKGGRKFIDIRVFWTDGNSEELRPSQKGLAISADSFEEFKALINSID
jgi:hypothetical protein